MSQIKVKELNKRENKFEMKVLEKVCLLCESEFLISFKTYKVQLEDNQLLHVVKSVSLQVNV